MKKFIVYSILILLVLMAIPTSAAVKKATLINSEGKKVVVEVGSYRAQLMFGAGYILMTDTCACKLGAFPGTDIYEPIRFHTGFGGAVLATSTSGTATTLKEKDLLNYSVFEMTPNVASFTYTLPATSTLTSILKNIGDTHSWVFQNATTTTATTLTLAAGAGWNLSGVDANVDVIAGAAYTDRVSQYVQCYRQSNKDIHCKIDKAIAAD